MNAGIIGEYADKVYAYAVNKTFSEYEAQELSQEILFTAVKELPKLKDESRFEPWLWGIARNVSMTFSRRMGKQRAMFSYDLPVDLAAEDDESGEDEELYSLLRTRISRLAAKYRDIIILHYYDGLSTNVIAGRLGLPEGTVQWRLSEARRRIKKELDENMEQSALRPVRMGISIYGNGNYNGKDRPWPSAFINDSLSQNILYYCAEEAKGIEELSDLCGLPAYYVEERVENLVYRNALTEQTKGRYITAFWIRTDKYAKYYADNAEKAVLPVADRIVEALKALAEEADKLDFYKGEKGKNDLLMLYGILAFVRLNAKFPELPYPPISPKYDGYCWEYLGDMRTGAYRLPGLGTQASCNGNEKGKYAYYGYCNIAGYPYRMMITDEEIDDCIEIIKTNGGNEKYTIATLIRDGFVRKDAGGKLRVLIPAFTCAQKDEFNKLVDQHFLPFIGEYGEIVGQFAAGYKKLFPKHLSETADRFCRSAFMDLFTVVIERAVREGKLERPTPDTLCNVLIENK